MMKTSRYKGLVLGSFFGTFEIDIIFGDGVGASLVPPHGTAWHFPGN